MQDQFEYLDFVCVPDYIKSAVIIYNNLFDQRLAPWARLRVPPNDLQCHKTPDERQLQPLAESLFALFARVIDCQPYPPLLQGWPESAHPEI